MQKLRFSHFFLGETGIFGFVFRYENSENFLSFEMSKARELRRISRVFKGKKTVISQIIDQKSTGFKENEFFAKILCVLKGFYRRYIDFEARINANVIEIFLGGASLFSFFEDSLFHGKIGFFIQNIKEVLIKMTFFIKMSIFKVYLKDLEAKTEEIQGKEEENDSFSEKLVKKTENLSEFCVLEGISSPKCKETHKTGHCYIESCKNCCFTMLNGHILCINRCEKMRNLLK